MMSGTGDPRVNFFISYTHKDDKWAEWIAWQLEDAGYSTRLQAWDFRPGSDFQYNEHQALINADRLIVVLSREYERSSYAFQELSVALARDPVGSEGHVVPVRVEDFEPSGLLRSRIYVDLAFTTSQTEAADRLLAGIRRERAKPPVPPAFPMTRKVTAAPEFPPNLSTIWHVPMAKDPGFVGRAAELEALGATLRKGGSAVVAVTGPEGIGKGALVTEYLYRHAHDYSCVWWVRARDKASLAGDYLALARALRLPTAGSGDLPAVIAAVHRWQERESGWLMVYDNISPELLDDRSRLLPQAPRGSVILTLQGEAPAGASVLELGPLPREDAIAVLRGKHSHDAVDAELLCDDAGGVPLALQQARGILEHTDVSPEKLHSTLPGSAPARERVAAGARMGYAAARLGDGLPAFLLNVCSFLAPDGIPFAFFDATSEAHPQSVVLAHGAEAIDQALQHLSSMAMIQVTRDTLSINTTVQEGVRGELSEDETRRWVSEAVAVVDAHLIYDHRDNRFWQGGARLLPHALAAAGHAERAHAWSAPLGRLLHKAGTFLVRSGEVERGLELYRRALDVARRLGDLEGEAVTLNSLGHAHWRRGPWREATSSYEAALRIYDTLHDPDAQALTRNNLALVRWDQGRWTRALSDYTHVLTLLEHLRSDSDDVRTAGGMTIEASDAGARTNLGHVYWDQGRWTDALECYTVARRSHRRAGARRGEARALNCIGLAHWEAGRWLDSLEAHAGAASLQRADGDPRSEAATLSCMGYVYAHQGRWGVALEHLGAARKTANEVGDANLQAIALHYEGVTLAAMGSLDEASTALREALDTLADPRDLHGRATVLNSLATVHSARQEFAQAAALHQESLDIDRSFGSRHGVAMTLRAMGVMATVKGACDVDARGAYVDARSYLREALRQLRALGAGHGEAMVHNDLGILRWCEGDYERAQRAFEHALEIRKAAGSVHAAAIARNNIACCQVRRGLVTQGARNLVRSRNIFRDVDSRNREAVALLNLGAAYRQLERPHRAAEYEQRAGDVNTRLTAPGAAGVDAESLRAALDEPPRDSPAPARLLVLRDIRGRHGEAFTLGNLSLVHYTIGRWPDGT
jgi:tetratricopeptide (TPR) repeat protein